MITSIEIYYHFVDIFFREFKKKVGKEQNSEWQQLKYFIVDSKKLIVTFDIAD